MAKKFPLQSILDLSQLHLDDATRRLGELISGEQQASERLNLLIQYRDEYHTRLLDAAKNGLSRNQWRNYQSFLDRLDTAIAQALELVAQSQERTAAGRQEWIAKHGRVKAFDALAQRHQARQDYAEQRNEQKVLDEHNARRHSFKEGSDES